MRKPRVTRGSIALALGALATMDGCGSGVSAPDPETAPRTRLDPVAHPPEPTTSAQQAPELTTQADDTGVDERPWRVELASSLWRA